MVYGSEAVLPTNLEYGSPRLKAYNEKTNKETRENAVDQLEEARDMALLGILNVTTKSRLSFLISITAPKMPNLSLMPLKPSCHPQHDIRDAVLKYAIALLNK